MGNFAQRRTEMDFRSREAVFPQPYFVCNARENCARRGEKALRAGYGFLSGPAPQSFFHLTPCGVSMSSMPMSLSSSRMRSASAKFFSLRAA